MKQDIENIIKKNLPEKVDDDGFAHDPSVAFSNGFDEALSQINTSLITDEVLKVVVEKIINGLNDIPWANRNECENEKVICENEIIDLLSNLSPNKENKNNG